MNPASESLYSNLRDFLTERPAKVRPGTPTAFDMPKFGTGISANLREFFRAAPRGRVNSALLVNWKEEPTLWQNLRDWIAPRKLPPLQTTSQPIPVPEIWSKNTQFNRVQIVSILVQAIRFFLLPYLGSVAYCSMKTLAELGVHFAIDDFGVGFSSIGYLQDMPVHTIKADLSFSEGIDRDERSCALLCSITMMGQALGLDVVVEGIERSSQLDHLREHVHAPYAQGFLMHRPMPLEQLLDVRRARTGRSPRRALEPPRRRPRSDAATAAPGGPTLQPLSAGERQLAPPPRTASRSPAARP